MTTAVNDVTGDRISSRRNSKEFLENFDKVFSEDIEPQEKTMSELYLENLERAKQKFDESGEEI